MTRELIDGRRFGRRFAPDVRDRWYPMHRAMRAVAPQPMTWEIGRTLDQGATPQCVAYAFAHWLACAPTVTTVATPAYEQAFYDRAQQLDEWPGQDYDGTSVRAGFKVMQEQERCRSYVWASSEQEIWDFIGTTGPVVMGTNWYAGMLGVDGTGFVAPTGAVVGGHAWLLYANLPDHYLLQNSWGDGWGLLGTAKIRRADVARLLQEDGEAGAGVELAIEPGEPVPPAPDRPGCLGRLLGLG